MAVSDHKTSGENSPKVHTMANPEHVELLKSGFYTLSEWRARNSQVCLDLTTADLRGVVLRGPLQSTQNRLDLSGSALSGANLRGAHIEHVNLDRCDLRSVRLQEASILRASLREVNLQSAKLSRCEIFKTSFVAANLQRCDATSSRFSQVNFTRANLSRANLRGATLDGVWLTDAECAASMFGGTTISQTDLSTAKGLSLATHWGPSEIGIGSIVQSKGTLPTAFLRAAGVPEVVLDYLPSVVQDAPPIQFYSCFISYSHKDEEFCKRLHARMQQEKLRVWYAPEDMPWGKKLHEEIDQAIRMHDKLLLVLSEQSMNSKWVATEIRRARRRELNEGKRVLFPIRLVPFEKIQKWELFNADEGLDLATEIREYLIPDFSNWKDHDAFETAFTRLLRDLKNEDLPSK